MSRTNPTEQAPGITADRLAVNLRAAIKASGLSQRKVAERTGMDPTALSKVLSGNRRVSTLELALICTATGSDVLGILEAEPLHGPSWRRGYQEAWVHARKGYESDDLERLFYGEVTDDGYTGCGVEHEGAYCDLRIDHFGPHHADLFWEAP